MLQIGNLYFSGNIIIDAITKNVLQKYAVYTLMSSHAILYLLFCFYNTYQSYMACMLRTKPQKYAALVSHHSQSCILIGLDKSNNSRYLVQSRDLRWIYSLPATARTSKKNTSAHALYVAERKKVEIFQLLRCPEVWH